jgi:hypothetical protein
MSERGLDVFRVLSGLRLRPLILTMLSISLLSVVGSSTVYGQEGVRGRDRKSGSKTKITTSVNGRRPAPHSLMIATEPRADCEIAITPSGRTRAIKLKLNGQLRSRLYQGDYLIVTECEGYEPSSRTVQVPRDTPANALSIAITPRSIPVIVRTVPAGAEILLDNRVMGSSSSDGVLRLPPLKPGRYELSASKEGYVKRSETLHVHKDLKPVVIELRRDELALRFELLEVSLANDDLQRFFDEYARLSNESRELGRARNLLWSLFSKLNKRSLQKLESIGPHGLPAADAEGENLRKFYHQAHDLFAREGLEEDRNFVLFAAFWEAKGIYAEWHANTQDEEKKLKLQAQLERIEALQPANAYLLLDLGYVYNSLADSRRAEQAFLNARASSPNWEFPYFALGFLRMNNAYTIKGDKKLVRSMLLLAAEEFEKAIARNGSFTRAYALASFCYADAANEQRAINLAAQAVNVAPLSGFAKYALGYAYFSSGRKRYQLARQYLSAALLAPEDRLDAAQINRANELLARIGLK